VTLKTGVMAGENSVFTCIVIDILKYITIQIYILNCNNVSQNYLFHCIFNQILPLKYFTNPKLLNNSAHLYIFFW